MQTIHAPNSPSLDIPVRVVRTRNSVYVFNKDGYADRVTCVWGTFAGQSFTYDVQASDVIHMGQPMILRGVCPVDGYEHSGVIVTTEVIDYAHA